MSNEALLKVVNLENEIYDGFVKDGLLSDITKALKRYSDSGDYIPVTGANLIDQGIKLKMFDGKDRKDDYKNMAMMILRKTASAVSMADVQSEYTNNPEFSQSMRNRATEVLSRLTHYNNKENNEFGGALADVAGIEADTLEYNTFGFKTRYDKGLKVETSAIKRIVSRAADMTDVGGLTKLALPRNVEIDLAVGEEAIKRGVVDESTVEKLTGFGLGLTASFVEMGLMGKGVGRLSSKFATTGSSAVASAFTKELASQTSAEAGMKIVRYLGHGVGVSMLSSWNGQVGAAERYDTPAGLNKLFADAGQNVVSMYFTDAILGPVISRLKFNSMLKGADKFSESNVRKTINGMITKGKSDSEITKALVAATNLKDAGVLNQYLSELRQGLVAKGTTERMTDLLGEEMKKSVYSAILNSKVTGPGLFALDFIADLGFDILSTTGLSKMGVTFTTHQKAMYDFSDMKNKDWSEMLMSVAYQRFSMRGMSHMISRGRGKLAQLKSGEAKSDVGSASWLAKQIGEKATVTQSAFRTMHNFLVGNELKDLDNFIRMNNPELDLESFSSRAEGLNAMVTDFLISQSADNDLSLIAGDWIYGNKHKAGMSKILSNIYSSGHSITKVVQDFSELVGTTFASKYKTTSEEAINRARLIAEDVVAHLSLGDLKDSTRPTDRHDIEYNLTGNIEEARNLYWSTLKGVSFSDEQVTKDFMTSFTTSFQKALLDKLSLEHNRLQHGRPQRLGLKNIIGIEDFSIDKANEGRILLTSDAYNTNIGLVHGRMQGIDVIKGLNTEEVNQLYHDIALYRDTFDRKDFKNAVNELKSYHYVLPRSASIDLENIEYVTNVLKQRIPAAGNLANLSDADKTRVINQIRGDMRNAYVQTVKDYSQKIRDISVRAQRSGLDKNASLQLSAYTLRLLAISERVGLIPEIRDDVLNLAKDSWLRESIKTLFSKEGAVYKLSSHPELADALGKENGFENLLASLMNMSETINLGRRAFASQLFNAQTIEGFVERQKMIGTGYGASPDQNTRAGGWLSIFSQEFPIKTGLFGELTINGNNVGHVTAADYSSVVYKIVNKTDNISADELNKAYAITMARNAIRDAFRDRNGNQLSDFFTNNLNNLRLSIDQEGKVNFDYNVNISNISKDDKISAIAANYAGVIQTDINMSIGMHLSTKGNSYRFIGGSLKTYDDVLKTLSKGSINNPDVEKAFFYITKKHGMNQCAAIDEIIEFIRYLDPTIDHNAYGQEIRGFAESVYKEQSAINDWQATLEVSDMTNPVIRSITPVFSNQRSALDMFDGVRVVNMDIPRDFINEVGSDFSNTKVMTALEAMRKQGFHPIYKKGNMMEWVFVHIPSTNKNGEIPVDRLKDFATQGIRRQLNLLSFTDQELNNFRAQRVADTDIGSLAEKALAYQDLINDIRNHSGNSEDLLRFVLDRHANTLLDELNKTKELEFSDVVRHQDPGDVANYTNEVVVMADSLSQLFEPLGLNGDTMREEFLNLFGTILNATNRNASNSLKLRPQLSDVREREAILKNIQDMFASTNPSQQNVHDNRTFSRTDAFMNRQGNNVKAQAKETLQNVVTKLREGKFTAAKEHIEILNSMIDSSLSNDIKADFARELADDFIEHLQVRSRFMYGRSTQVTSEINNTWRKTRDKIRDYATNIRDRNRYNKDEITQEFFKLLAFGDINVAEGGNITKRSSFSLYTPYLDREGNFANADYERFFTDTAQNRKIYISFTGDDGQDYIPRDFMDALTVTMRNTSGKYTHASAAAGIKFNAISSEGLVASVRSKAAVAGVDISDADATWGGVRMGDLNDAIFLDISTVKTFLPTLYKSLVDIPATQRNRPTTTDMRFIQVDTSNRLAPANASNTVIPQTRLNIARTAKMLAATTLHSATETFVRDRGEFGYATSNIGNELSAVQVTAHTIRASRFLKGVQDFDFNAINDVALWSGTQRKRMAVIDNNMSGMMKVESLKDDYGYNGHVLEEGELRAINSALRRGIHNDASDKHNMPTGKLGGQVLTEMLIKWKKSAPLQDKNRIEAMANFWHDISSNPNNTADIIRRYSLGYKVNDRTYFINNRMIGVFDSTLNRFIVDSGNVNHQAAFNYLSRLSQDVLNKLGYTRATRNGVDYFVNNTLTNHRANSSSIRDEFTLKYIVSEFTRSTFEALSSNEDAPIMRLSLADPNNPEEEKRNIFMANMVRFPTERPAQDFQILLEGVDLFSTGIGISSYHLYRQMGGDFDGDTVKLIGLSTNDYKQALSDSFGFSGTEDADLLRYMRDQYTKAVLQDSLHPNQSIAGSRDEPHYSDPGTAIGALDYASSLQSAMHLHGGQFHDVICNAVNEVLHTRMQHSTQGKSLLNQINEVLNFHTSVVDDSAKVIVDDNTIFTKDVNIHHVVKESVTSVSHKIGDETRSISVMIAKDGRNRLRAYTILNHRGGDGIAPIIMSIFEPKNLEAMQGFPTTAVVLRAMANNLAIAERNFINANTNLKLEGDFSEYNRARNRMLLGKRLSVVSSQGIVRTMNGIGVDNMSNNTILALKDRIATSPDKDYSILENFINKIAIASHLNTTVHVSSDASIAKNPSIAGTSNVLIEIGKIRTNNLNIVGNSIDTNGTIVNKVTNQILNKISNGDGVFEIFSKQNFRNVKALLKGVPDAEQLHAGFYSAYKLLQFYGDGPSQRQLRTKLPSYYQVAIAQFGETLKNSQAGAGKVVSDLRKMLDGDAQKKIFSDPQMDSIWAGRSLKLSDIYSESELQSLKKSGDDLAIKHPSVALFNFKGASNLLKQYYTLIFNSSKMKQAFDVMKNQDLRMFAGVSGLENFQTKLADQMNEISKKRYDSDDVINILQDLKLDVEETSFRHYSAKEVASFISDYEGELNPSIISKELEDKMRGRKDSVFGFGLVKSRDSKREILSVEDVVEKMTIDLAKDSIDPTKASQYEDKLTMYKAIMSLMGVEQQRVVGLMSLGITKKTINKIDETLSLQDVIEIAEEQNRMSVLSRKNVLEDVTVVKEEVATLNIDKGMCR